MTQITASMVTFDCSDAVALARWWAGVTSGTIENEDEWFTVVTYGDASPNLGFQKVPDPTPGKNRVHLDFHVEDREAEVARFIEAGATLVGVREEGGFTWTTLADPDGNQFCLA